MPCIAWTAAQLALMQKHLDESLTYPQVAEAFKKDTGKAINKNVIAGLVSRGYLKHSYTGFVCKRSRVPVHVMQHRLTLIRDAYKSGLTDIGSVAAKAGVTYDQARRGMERLNLKAIARPRTDNAAGVNLNKKKRIRRTLERRTPQEYIADPIAKLGVHFNDKRANHCGYIVAKDPDDGLARYCGNHRLMRGRYFASPYCCDHHIVCHRIEYLEAAE